MPAQEKKKLYTSEEFLSMMPSDSRAELIDGVIYDMSPSPSVKHQRISSRISRAIGNYIDERGGNCEVFEAPLDVRLSDCSTVQPDVFVLCDTSKLDERRCNGAPDWVIEILSPSDGTRDTNEKVYLYSMAGVREYWVIDPENERVMVYIFSKPNLFGFYTFKDEITVGIYKNAEKPLVICLSELMPGK